MNYSRIFLLHPLRWWPGWHPGLMQVKHQFEYCSPDYVITREIGDGAYQVQHVETGQRAEVPIGNVKGAEVMP